MRPALITSVLLAALAPLTAPPAHAAVVPPGHVYFWAEPGQMGPGGACLYRAIRPDDHSDNWSWATKFDGVSDTTMSCEVG